MYKYFLAFKYLVTRRITLASVIVTTLGVMVMAIVYSIITGYIMKFEEVLQGNTADLIVERIDSNAICDYESVLREVSTLENVKAVAPVIEKGVLLSYRNKEYKWCIMKGIAPEWELKIGRFREYVGDGLDVKTEFARLHDGESPVLMGEAVLSVEGVEPGKVVEITAARASGNENMVTGSFRIIGFTHSGGFDIDSQECFVPISAAQEMLGLRSDETTHVKIQVTDQRYLTDVKFAVAKALTGQEFRRLDREKDDERDIFGNYRISTWRERKRNELKAARNDLTVLSLIVVFIIFGAGFVTLAILVMMVFEKRRDIGVLKAVGCSWYGTVAIFLLMGLLIGLLGSLLGIVSGKFVSDNINAIAGIVESIFGIEVFPKEVYYFDRIPAYLAADAVFKIVLITVGVSLLSSVAAAVRAAFIDPVRALRYE